MSHMCPMSHITDVMPGDLLETTYSSGTGVLLLIFQASIRKRPLYITMSHMCPMSHKSIALVADQLASIRKSPLYSEFYIAKILGR